MSSVTFEYRAVDRTGAKRRGVTSAPTRVEAFRQLSALGLTPVRIRAARARRGRRSGWIRPRDVADLTYQLSVLIDSRIPIGDGLMSIAEQEQNPRLRGVIVDVATRIESGCRIADALAAHGDVFGDVYVASIRAAERTGTLGRVLEHLSELLERSQETRSQIRSALTYPSIVVIVLALAVTFLVTVVVPRFAAMFAQRGVELPLLTRGLLAVGQSVQHFWWAYLLGAGVAVWAVRRSWRSARSRLAMDRLLHRVPYLRRLLVGAAISRFVRVLGVSLGAGLGLIECLELSGRASGRPSLAADAQTMADAVRAGRRLSDALAGCEYLTPFCKRMLSAGEESAQMPRMCAVIARSYDRQTAYLAKNIGTVIEPVLVVLIAGVVLVVALAVFLPMWNMVALLG